MNKLYLALALATIGVSGCSNLAGKTPQEMLSLSMERSLTKDYSYNFHGEMKAYVSDKDKGVDPEGAKASSTMAKASETVAKATSEADAAADAAAAAADAATMADDAEDSLSDYTDYTAPTPSLYSGFTGLGGRAADYLNEYPALSRYVGNMAISANGAVDLAAKKIEIVPEISLKNRNDGGYIRMPMLLDGEDMSLTVELPDTVLMAMGFKVEPAWRERLSTQPIRVAVSDVEKLKGMPVKTVMQAIVVAAYKSYGELPADQYQALPMDEFGREIGAKHRIDIKLTASNSEAMSRAMGKHFASEFERLQREKPEAGVSAENYEEAKKGVMDIFGDDLVKESASFWEQVFGSAPNYSFYLDRRGRMLGYRQYMQANGDEKALNLDSRVKMFNFGKPVFTFKPEKSQTLSINEVAQAFGKDKNSSSVRLLGMDEVLKLESEAADFDSVEVPETPYVIKETLIKQ